MSVGDLVEYEYKGRKAEGTVTEVFYVGEVLMARVQLAKTIFGYSPPELVVANADRLRLVSRSQGVRV